MTRKKETRLAYFSEKKEKVRVKIIKKKLNFI